MATYWLIGIIFSMALTGVAVWWVIHNLKDEPEVTEQNGENKENQPSV